MDRRSFTVAEESELNKGFTPLYGEYNWDVSKGYPEFLNFHHYKSGGIYIPYTPTLTSQGLLIELKKYIYAGIYFAPGMVITPVNGFEKIFTYTNLGASSGHYFHGPMAPKFFQIYGSRGSVFHSYWGSYDGSTGVTVPVSGSLKYNIDFVNKTCSLSLNGNPLRTKSFTETIQFSATDHQINHYQGDSTGLTSSLLMTGLHVKWW